MFNKKISMILITLVFMLSLSAVAAVDSNQTDDMAAGEIDEEPPSVRSDLLAATNESSTTSSDSEYEIKVVDVAKRYSGSVYSVVLSQNKTPVSKAKITFDIDGVKYLRTTGTDGKAVVALKLDPGTYLVSASYGNITNSQKIKVLSVVTGKDLTKTYSTSQSYSATFRNTDGSLLKNKNVKFIVDGKNYTRKTNAKGVATIAINLKIGTHTLIAVHPKGYRSSNKIVVKSSITASDVTKHYLSSKVFSATFYNKNGKVLNKKYIQFKAHGSTFKVKTNAKGVAKITIISKPTTFKMYSINPYTGQKKANTVKILKTLSASAVTTFSDRTTAFKVKLYKDDKLVKNAKVYVYIKNSKKTAKTDANGIATVNFKLAKGTYTFKSYDPYTKYSINTKVTVKLASIKASDDMGIANKTSKYTVTLLKQNGDLAKNTNMQITLNGNTQTVKTNAYGAASITYVLDVGKYKVTCKDLSTGYTITKTITVYEPPTGTVYDKYGVSEDGYSILAIGRASAAGEYDKYGYTFYMTEFDRTCPYCGSHELYWGIFFAGNEYSNYGVFPATGNIEGSSAEGLIVCAHCDSDWSVFGHNHGGSGGNLKVITKTVSSTKDDAYALLKGNYVIK
ncbi:hypothetical protein [Methanobrevibacter sp.]|uniref:hypothetical protein n=1 Tax=Methanobrevibacter sp. TaxID=66852 RepID=UPI00388FB7B8